MAASIRKTVRKYRFLTTLFHAFKNTQRFELCKIEIPRVPAPVVPCTPGKPLGNVRYAFEVYIV